MDRPREIEVPINQIEIDPENVRSEYDPALLNDLRAALQSEGAFINPPLVYRTGKDRYRVKHGSTRVLAAQGLLDKIRVRVTDPPASESSKILSQMGENLLQGSLRPADIGAALKRLRQADGHERSLSQLVGALKSAGVNRTRSWVFMHLALAELAPEVRVLINRGQLGAEVAFQLRSLPPDQQVSWAERIVAEQLSLAEVKRQLGPDAAGGEAAEALEADMRQRLTDRSREAERGNSEEPRAARAGVRQGRVMSRWSLVAVPVGPQVAQRVRRRELQALERTDWAEKVAPIQRQLAQEAIFLGGYPADEAMQLAERAASEAQFADETIMMALSGLGRLLTDPVALSAGGALAELASIRLKALLRAAERN